MDYYSAVCDQEQAQRYEQSLISQDYSDLELQASASRGPGVMCGCGSKTSEDCKRNCLNW
jgi:hypothetical protein